MQRAPSDWRDVVTGDGELYSSVPWGHVPRNGFWFLNNTFGRGGFVNGTDFVQSLTASPLTFPCGALMEWRWPTTTSGSPFAFAYPFICYGRTEYGNPFNVVGPWPQRVTDASRLLMDYDIVLGGNLQSFNVLVDLFLTSAATTDGSHAVEVSMFPYRNGMPLVGTGVHRFSWGDAVIGQQGAQILIQPAAPMLAARVDLRELLRYLMLGKWITGNEWLQGVQFGVEVQVPAAFNTAPHQGWMRVNRLSYDWI